MLRAAATDEPSDAKIPTKISILENRTSKGDYYLANEKTIEMSKSDKTAYGKNSAHSYSPWPPFAVNSEASDYSYRSQHGEDTKLISDKGSNSRQSQPQYHHVRRGLRIQKSPPSIDGNVLSGA